MSSCLAKPRIIPKLVVAALFLLFAASVFSAENISTNAVVRFEPGRGFYDKPFSLRLISTEPALAIHYTTDGAAPTLRSPAIDSAPLIISNTVVIRAALFGGAVRVSDVVTHTYLFLDQVMRQPKSPPGWPSGPHAWDGFPSDYEMDPAVALAPEYRDRLKSALLSLPTVSVSLAADDLFGSSRGIYLHSMERGDAWERPCSAEMILSNGATAFQVQCGLRIQGNYNRIPQKSPKHSFRLVFREKYGPGKLQYPIFPDS